MEKIRKALDLARAERLRSSSLERVAAGIDSGIVAPDSPPATDAPPPSTPERHGLERARVAAGAARAAAAAASAQASHASAASFAGEQAVDRSDDANAATVRSRRFSPDPAVLERNRVVRANSASPAAGAFRLLRTHVLQRMAEHGWRTLAVTSPTADAETAAVALNLASAIAADPRHYALLVDLDLRAPRIAPLLGMDAAVGLESVLAGAASLAGCLWRTDEFARLALIPVARPVPRAAELVTSAAAARLFAEVRDRYPDRIIVYSLPPVLGSDDVLAFLPSVECALLVVTEDRTRRADVAEAMRLLRRTPVVGTVLGSSAAAGRSSE